MLPTGSPDSHSYPTASPIYCFYYPKVCLPPRGLSLWLQPPPPRPVRTMASLAQLASPHDSKEAPTPHHPPTWKPGMWQSVAPPSSLNCQGGGSLKEGGRKGRARAAGGSGGGEE